MDSEDDLPRDLGESSDEVWPPWVKGQNLPGAGLLGMRLFIAALIMPFLASIIGYFVTRAHFPGWPPADAPPLPHLFWLSTIFIVITSIVVQWGVRSARAEDQQGLRRAMIATLVCGVGFLICQWIAFDGLLAGYDLESLQSEDFSKELRMLLVTFCLLVGLHALHVIGGVLFQSVVTARALLGKYRYYHHPGVTYAAMYWHFLGAMWVLVLVALWFGNRP